MRIFCVASLFFTACGGIKSGTYNVTWDENSYDLWSQETADFDTSSCAPALGNINPGAQMELDASALSFTEIGNEDELHHVSTSNCSYATDSSAVLFYKADKSVWDCTLNYKVDEMIVPTDDGEVSVNAAYYGDGGLFLDEETDGVGGWLRFMVAEQSLYEFLTSDIDTSISVDEEAGALLETAINTDCYVYSSFTLELAE